MAENFGPSRYIDIYTGRVNIREICFDSANEIALNSMGKSTLQNQHIACEVIYCNEVTEQYIFNTRHVGNAWDVNSCKTINCHWWLTVADMCSYIAIGTINNTSKSGGRNWILIFDYQG